MLRFRLRLWASTSSTTLCPSFFPTSSQRWSTINTRTLWFSPTVRQIPFDSMISRHPYYTPPFLRIQPRVRCVVRLVSFQRFFGQQYPKACINHVSHIYDSTFQSHSKPRSFQHLGQDSSSHSTSLLYERASHGNHLPLRLEGL